MNKKLLSIMLIMALAASYNTKASTPVTKEGKIIGWSGPATAQPFNEDLLTPMTNQSINTTKQSSPKNSTQNATKQSRLMSAEAKYPHLQAMAKTPQFIPKQQILTKLHETLQTILNNMDNLNVRLERIEQHLNLIA